MIRQTQYVVSSEDILQARKALPDKDYSKLSLNSPTTDFFYDEWIIKPEYVGSVWERLLAVLPTDIGEARIIKIPPGKCYQAHADIDDRYHLNIVGNKSFLINLESGVMYPTVSDNLWYDMDASSIHSAANFGDIDRIQLVVRKLLIRSNINTMKHVRLTYSNTRSDYLFRYHFDNSVSSWLNKINKMGKMNNFKCSETSVEFDIDPYVIDDLKLVLPVKINMEIC